MALPFMTARGGDLFLSRLQDKLHENENTENLNVIDVIASNTTWNDITISSGGQSVVLDLGWDPYNLGGSTTAPVETTPEPSPTPPPAQHTPPTALSSVTAVGDPAAASLFGGNILAPRSQMEGDGSYSELIEDLGASGLRYPGGSLTEEYFDILNPDAETATGNENGQTIDFISISDFMEAATKLGSQVTIVIPTRDQLSTTLDANGNRYPDIDEEALRDFIYDTVTGVYGDAQIAAFEIGNEYWGSGRMNSFEYGRLASEMTEIIDQELQLIQETLGTGGDIDIVVQMGTNFGYASLDEEYEYQGTDEIIDDLNAKYNLELNSDVVRSSGDLNWAEVSNEIIMSFFDGDKIEAIDGIAAHIYSKEPALPGQRSFHLNTINETWNDEFSEEDLDIYVTEWNSSGATSLFERDEDYGLRQAHEMLNMIEEFMYSGVDVAHAWPLLQNTANAFSQGFNHETLTPAGNMFAMMSTSLPGKTMLDFNSSSRETEVNLNDIDVHGFYGDGELVFFLASTSEDGASTDVDISNLIDGYDHMSIEVLGVEPGSLPGSNSSPSVIQALDESLVYDDGFISAVLAPGEIMKVVITNIQPTAAFEPVTTKIDNDIPAVITQGNDDEIIGGASAELLKGGDGNDTISGLSGEDTLNGGKGDDHLSGGDGNDQIRGREGDDFLSGENGNDYLRGESGNDYLKGSAGSDTLIGGWGDDTLRGGQEDDLLNGGPGSNKITTGYGKDTVLINDDGQEFNTTITDFTPGRDTIEIYSEDVIAQEDLEIQVTSEEIVLLLSGDDSKRIVLEGEFDEEEIWESGSIKFTYDT